MRNQTKLLLLLATSLVIGCSKDGSSGGGGFSIGIGDTLRRGTGINIDTRDIQTAQASVKAVRALSLSDADEVELGRSVAIALTNTYPLNTDEKLNAYVTKVGLTVATASERPELPYTFGVLTTPQIGAFSGPGGYVFVTTGALAAMKDESELAGVLAHEIAHVARRHGLQAVKESGFLDAAVDAARAQGGAFSYVPNSVADQFVNVVLKSGYSRAQEGDADEYALKYLKASGYSQQGYPAFLDRMHAIKGAESNKAFGTHPGLDDRAAKLRQLTEKSPGGAVLAERFAAAAAR